ncbi:hypothetical protein PPERSA_02271 [Pseudocohnilembus persalinus]|uniref:Transmembrane protein n=1 Tax=Pseudocohnilembus persalinus TaxID=266149 RepID=A0A0V0QKI8_PSEPJ|nr:hypothetical protein PPERSA_02271 [Pseudocohnilembus persalinus]|eukprot:KRX02781.1 hypothetical protein PPERSA_02271 [Pseudocohnilembus persalinus]
MDLFQMTQISQSQKDYYELYIEIENLELNKNNFNECIIKQVKQKIYIPTLDNIYYQQYFNECIQDFNLKEDYLEYKEFTNQCNQQQDLSLQNFNDLTKMKQNQNSNSSFWKCINNQAYQNLQKQQQIQEQEEQQQKQKEEQQLKQKQKQEEEESKKYKQQQYQQQKQREENERNKLQQKNQDNQNLNGNSKESLQNNNNNNNNKNLQDQQKTIFGMDAQTGSIVIFITLVIIFFLLYKICFGHKNQQQE